MPLYSFDDNGNRIMENAGGGITGNFSVASSITVSPTERWSFCPRDACKLEAGWHYCPQCGVAVGTVNWVAAQYIPGQTYCLPPSGGIVTWGMTNGPAGCNTTIVDPNNPNITFTGFNHISQSS